MYFIIINDAFPLPICMPILGGHQKHVTKVIAPCEPYTVHGGALGMGALYG